MNNVFDWSGTIYVLPSDYPIVEKLEIEPGGITWVAPEHFPVLIRVTRPWWVEGELEARRMWNGG